MLHFLEGCDQRVEVGPRIFVQQRLKLLPVLCDKLAERRHDLVGRKLTESR